jgi:hypothetical protein
MEHQGAAISKSPIKKYGGCKPPLPVGKFLLSEGEG